MSTRPSRSWRARQPDASRPMGFIPRVSTPALDRMGTGDIDIVPRQVLILHDSVSAENFIKAMQYAISPCRCNISARCRPITICRLARLPRCTIAGWLGSLSGATAAGLPRSNLVSPPAAERHTDRAVRPRSRQPVASWLTGAYRPPHQRFRSRPADHRHRHPAVGFEAPPLPQEAQLQAVTLSQPGERWLTLQRNGQPLSDAIAMTSWGGYLLPPFGVIELPNDTQRWVTDPFRFLQAARLPAVPVPDVTTDHGRRTLLVHIDGDGFASRSELPGTPFASGSCATDPAPLPAASHRVSDRRRNRQPGLFGSISPTLENIARQIFAEPYIEPASHSFLTRSNGATGQR